ncbi:MAG TPA: NADH-quinone oxidoreductase subunit NuoN [Dongiaceae bacterium]
MASLNLGVALPEIWVALSAMVLLLVGAFVGDRAMRLIGLLTMAVMAIAIVVLLGIDVSNTPQVAFSGHFIVDRFAVFAKVLTLIASIVSVGMSFAYAEREGMARFELPLLMLLATFGMMLMISANDLISLYVGLELQSLALYVTAAMQRDAVRSAEAGLKYFVLGALSSGILLYGASMIYGFVGTVSFAGLSTALSGAMPPSLGLIVGLVFLCVGLAFKISAVPFHMWTPDVYEGAPTPITAFFSAAPKVAAICLFTRVLVDAFGGLTPQWQQIIFAISVASMILGAFAAIGQRNIKRLMAYSAIGNAGYALVGLAAGTQQGVSGLLFYMTAYVPMTLGSFAVILAMRQKGKMVEEIADLSGLAKSQPWLAHVFAALLFSLAGIPPLLGFFGKWMVFVAAVNQSMFVLVVIGVLTSVVSAYYYVRIVRVMYFDEAVGSFDRVDGSLKLVLAVSVAAVVAGILFINPIQSSAIAAASSLFPG